MDELNSVGKWVLILGLGITTLGGVLWLAGRLGLPLGRLPGDIRFEAGGMTCFIPLATSILLSLALTLLLNLVLRGRGR
ncbi:MAG: DUF2905 domain-containing protein [Anaerolineales bacterium]